MVLVGKSSESHPAAAPGLIDGDFGAFRGRRRKENVPCRDGTWVCSLPRRMGGARW